jgi:hypothetical protein
VLFKQQTVTKTGKLLKKQLPVYYWLVFFKKAQNKMEWVIAVECQVRICFSCIGVKTSYFLMR